MDLEPTQRLESTEDEDLEENESFRNENEVYALMKIVGESDKVFEIHLGENLVGRDPIACQIFIDSKVIL